MMSDEEEEEPILLEREDNESDSDDESEREGKTPKQRHRKRNPITNSISEDTETVHNPLPFYSLDIPQTKTEKPSPKKKPPVKN
jgi:hypothetical protein